MENTLGWSGVSHLFSPSTNLTRGLAARRLFKIHLCREGTIQTSLTSPRFEPSPNETEVIVADHYTGWATQYEYNLLSDTGEKKVSLSQSINFLVVYLRLSKVGCGGQRNKIWQHNPTEEPRFSRTRQAFKLIGQQNICICLQKDSVMSLFHLCH
ncbi:hypothetical protein TNCV_351711 [Trichonephila clavipes]|nr:hypothetical protein TNCV_351711 [Trichonephila clavipes]